MAAPRNLLLGLRMGRRVLQFDGGGSDIRVATGSARCVVMPEVISESARIGSDRLKWRISASASAAFSRGRGAGHCEPVHHRQW